MDKERAAAAFGLLTDETRVAIVRELALHQGERASDRELSFAELRKRVGTRDSGQFNYHLDKLCGHFVEQGEAGYSLTPVGVRVAGAIVGGYYADVESQSGELSTRCPACEERLTATYENGLFTIGCSNEQQVSYFASSRLLADRSLDEAAEVLALAAFSSMRVFVEGACSECYGTVDWSFEFDDEPILSVVCRDCGLPITGPPEMSALYEPEAAETLRRHGYDRHSDPLETLLAVQDLAEVAVDSESGTATVRFPFDDAVEITLAIEDGRLAVRQTA